MAEIAGSGVYVAETLELGVSVASGETAVPVFLGDFGDAVDSVAPLASWQEFTGLGDALNASAFAAVLRGYFANGGGRCYLANTAERSLEETLAAVAKFSDITILGGPGPVGRGREAGGRVGPRPGRLRGRAPGDGDPARRSRAHPRTGESGRRRLGPGGRAAPPRALYHPWVRQGSGGEEVVVAPSGILAGVWPARTGSGAYGRPRRTSS
ncbi:hypothetical protein ACFH04_00020 [Streptomyces noboritoensis]|uniref:Carbohydrate kinase PfkB domain-containing protein n=1 Tax=Streptomyces noboritoensis TaxID=67337 RepID=A0ABV6T8M7_9ACTN